MVFPLFFNKSGHFAILIYFMGMWIEGIAASKLVWKIAYYIIHRESPNTTPMSKRLMYYFSLSFLTIVSVGAILSIESLRKGDFGPQIPTYVLFIWTIFTVVTSGLGLTYKLWGTTPANISPPNMDGMGAIENHYNILLIGSILAISGTEIYNFNILTGKSLAEIDNELAEMVDGGCEEREKKPVIKRKQKNYDVDISRISNTADSQIGYGITLTDSTERIEQKEELMEKKKQLEKHLSHLMEIQQESILPYQIRMRLCIIL
jgi:hypothetical protein